MVEISVRGVAKDEPPEPDYATKAFWVKCVKCEHCWAAAYWPLDAEKFSRIALSNSKQCPKCGAKKSVVAKQHDGILDEPPAPSAPTKGE